MKQINEVKTFLLLSEYAEVPYIEPQYVPRARPAYQTRNQSYQPQQNRPIPRPNDVYDDGQYRAKWGNPQDHQL